MKERLTPPRRCSCRLNLPALGLCCSTALRTYTFEINKCQCFKAHKASQLRREIGRKKLCKSKKQWHGLHLRCHVPRDAPRRPQIDLLHTLIASATTYRRENPQISTSSRPIFQSSSRIASLIDKDIPQDQHGLPQRQRYCAPPSCGAQESVFIMPTEKMDLTKMPWKLRNVPKRKYKESRKK